MGVEDGVYLLCSQGEGSGPWYQKQEVSCIHRGASDVVLVFLTFGRPGAPPLKFQPTQHSAPNCRLS